MAKQIVIRTYAVRVYSMHAASWNSPRHQHLWCFLLLLYFTLKLWIEIKYFKCCLKLRTIFTMLLLQFGLVMETIYDAHFVNIIVYCLNSIAISWDCHICLCMRAHEAINMNHALSEQCINCLVSTKSIAHAYYHRVKNITDWQL